MHGEIKSLQPFT